MAAARASLSEVLTPEAYELLESREERLLRGCQEVIDRHGLPGYSIGRVQSFSSCSANRCVSGIVLLRIASS